MLTSCLYPPKPPSNVPNNGFIPQQLGDFNLPTDRNIFTPPPFLFPSPPSYSSNPGAGGSYATSKSEYPWTPSGEPPTDPLSNNNELVPINPFVRVPLTLKPNNGPTIPPTSTTRPADETGNYGQVEGNSYGLPDFGHNGVESGGGIYGSPITPIVPVNKLTQPPYPFEEITKPIEGDTGGIHPTKHPIGMVSTEKTPNE